MTEGLADAAGHLEHVLPERLGSFGSVLSVRFPRVCCGLLRSLAVLVRRHLSHLGRCLQHSLSTHQLPSQLQTLVEHSCMGADRVHAKVNSHETVVW